MLGDLKTEAGRVGGDLRYAPLLTVEIDPAVGVVHREVGGRQLEVVDVGHCQIVRAGNPHRAGLGIQPIAERLAQRVDAPADPLLRLQDNRLVSSPLQFIGRHQPSHPRSDDDDALARATRLRQAVVDDRSQVGITNRHRESPDYWLL